MIKLEKCVFLIKFLKLKNLKNHLVSRFQMKIKEYGKNLRKIRGKLDDIRVFPEF